MGSESSHAKGASPKRVEPRAPASGGGRGALEVAQQDAGNLAISRALRGFGLRAKLSVSSPGDPDEDEADRVADAVVRGAPMPAPTATERATNAGGAGAADAAAAFAAGVVRGGGQPLPLGVQHKLEGSFGRNLSHVRVHTDESADAGARAIQARAFTRGDDIAFARDQFRPESPDGQRLIAHEVTHVLQGSRSPERLRRKTEPGPESDTGAAAPSGVAQPVELFDIRLAGIGLGSERGKDDDQTISVTSPPQGEPCHLRYYVVPVDKLRKALEGADQPQTPAGEKPGSVASDPAHPAGSTATTLDGKQLRVVASTPEHVITAEYTKFAVGAGSTSAVRLQDGSVILMDAGINNAGMGSSEAALRKLTLEKLAEFIGSSRVRELLLSHVHDDHTSIAAEILRKYPVETIRLNVRQRNTKAYKELRAELAAAQEARLKQVREKFVQDMLSERVAWEKSQGSEISAGIRQENWERHVAEEFVKRSASMPEAATARERVLTQLKGKAALADYDMATGKDVGNMPAGAAGKGQQFGAADPYALEEMVGPARKGIDRNASTYVVELKSGLRFLVLPDVRANDMANLVNRFRAATSGLPQAVAQVWDMSHHMQAGWYSGGVKASQLAKIADFLTEFRNQQGSDIVTVSTQTDLKSPAAKTLVDPVNIWVLRSLGFQVFIGTAGNDVKLYQILTSQGRRLVGVNAAAAPGATAPNLTLARAKSALARFGADLQAETAALKAMKDPVAKTEQGKKVAEIKARVAALDAAYKACLAEVAQKLGGSHTTQSLADTAKVELPQQKALDALLDQYKVEQPAVIDVRLSEGALAVLGQAPVGPEPAPGTPEARGRRIARVRESIEEISARVRAGDASPEVRMELVNRLLEYRALVNEELAPSDPQRKPLEGVSKELLTDSLKTIDQKLEALKTAESAKTFKRVGGQVVEQHAVVLQGLPGTPSRAAQVTGEALEVAGRGMGLVMLVSSIRGEGDLVKRLSEGQASGKEFALGTAHNVIAGGVALKMVRGIPVANGVFVVMAVLDVGQVLARKYETDEQRNTEVAFAATSQALNLALMALGGALMTQVEAPPLMVLGFLVTLAGPTILEALGVHDFLERQLAFEPPSVVEVNQNLRKLMQKYSAIIGSISLAARAKDEAALEVTVNREEVKKEAELSLAARKKETVELENDLMNAFEAAYSDALKGHAGLRELDAYRAQFLKLRHEAGLEDYRGQVQVRPWYGYILAPGITKTLTTPSRESVEERFKAMDAKLSLKDASFDDIRLMPQWEKLDEELTELSNVIEGDAADAEYHEQVRKHDLKVTAMVDNARYRLAPRDQGAFRTEALLAPGSSGRATYEKELSPREQKLQTHRVRYLERSQKGLPESVSLRPTAPVDGASAFQLDAGVAVMQAEGVVKRFSVMVDAAPAPPSELVTRIFSSTEVPNPYQAYVQRNPDYALELQRLQTTEGLLTGMLQQAKRLLGSASAAGAQPLSERLSAAQREAQTTRSRRYAVRGLLYPSEVAPLALDVGAREAKAMADWMAGPNRAKALTPEELSALAQHSNFGDPGQKVIPPLETRLSVVPGLTKLDANGYLTHVFRIVGKGVTMTGVIFVRPFELGPADNALVGVFGDEPPNPLRAPPGSRDPYGNPQGPRRLVLPLNQKAIDVIGEYSNIYTIAVSNLARVKPEDLAGAAKQAKQP